MEHSDFGLECENCECLVCVKNDVGNCENCNKCNGNDGYSRWKMNCKNFRQCKDPDETIKIVLGNIIS